MNVSMYTLTFITDFSFLQNHDYVIVLKKKYVFFIRESYINYFVKEEIKKFKNIGDISIVSETAKIYLF